MRVHTRMISYDTCPPQKVVTPVNLESPPFVVARKRLRRCNPRSHCSRCPCYTTTHWKQRVLEPDKRSDYQVLCNCPHPPITHATGSTVGFKCSRFKNALLPYGRWAPLESQMFRTRLLCVLAPVKPAIERRHYCNRTATIAVMLPPSAGARR